MANTTGKKWGGRQKGTSNKITSELRDTIQGILNTNIEKFPEWIAELALTDPAKAIDANMKLMEYILPKLTRTEISGVNGDPIEVDLTNISLDEAAKLYADSIK